jgi:hypothetical protein
MTTRRERRGVMFRSLGWTLAVAASVSLLAAAAAQAHHGPWRWTTSRAERMVTADVPMRLPPEERATLEAEVRLQRGAYLRAAMVASEGGDWLAAGMYNNLVLQLTSAISKVESGLGIDDVQCTGIGRAVNGRYRHFRCAATSGVIEIPTVASIEREGDREIVTQGPPRLVGPLNAIFGVHVRGETKLTYRTMG